MIKSYQREHLVELIEVAESSKLCSLSADPEEQTAVMLGFQHLLSELRVLAPVFLPPERAATLTKVQIDFSDIYTAYEASATIAALLPELKDAASSNMVDQGVNQAIVRKELMANSKI